MALIGKLDDFSIVEIFQLISQQQRSGVLTIQSKEKKARIFFVNGFFSKAHPLYISLKKNPFGAVALNACLVTEEGLQRALIKMEESAGSLEQAFFDLNLLSQSQIQKVNDYLLRETVYDILQWKTGDYEFTLQEIDHDQKFCNLIPTEHVLLDILRMIDEEPELVPRTPHHGIVFQKIPLDEGKKTILDRFNINEKNVYQLVDSVKTTQEIINRSLLGKCNTLKVLHSLLDARLIKKISLERFPSTKPSPKKNRWEYFFYGILPFLIVSLLFGLRLLFFPSLSKEASSFKKIFAKTESLKIKNALNVYFLSNGRFPFILEDLIKAGFITNDDLLYLHGVKLSYRLMEDGSYRLE